MERLWLKGGYPRAFLLDAPEDTNLWLENYIQTFLEKDIPQIGLKIPANTLHRFWIMLSHYHGQVVNLTELGRSFGISDMTVRHYIDILEKTFMIRALQPWHTNTSKRLVKRPKIYLSDSGIFHALQTIQTQTQLFNHIKLGASWEGFALELAARSIGLRREALFFWGTHSGAEIDLFWQFQGQNFGVEIKYQDAPKITRSLQSAMTDLNLAKAWLIYPGQENYSLAKNIQVLPLKQLPQKWQY